MRKYLTIYEEAVNYSVYDLATDPFWISLYMRKFFSFFLSVRHGPYRTRRSNYLGYVRIRSTTGWCMTSRGSQKVVIYLGWPIAPSYMNPNAGGVVVAGSQPMSTGAHGTQINFGDLTPYLAYDDKLFNLSFYRHKTWLAKYGKVSPQ